MEVTARSLLICVCTIIMLLKCNGITNTGEMFYIISRYFFYFRFKNEIITKWCDQASYKYAFQYKGVLFKGFPGISKISISLGIKISKIRVWHLGSLYSYYKLSCIHHYSSILSILLSGEIPLYVGCQDIYKISTFLNGTGLYNNKTIDNQKPFVFSYKCIPRLTNRFCGVSVDDQQHWKVYQPCKWLKDDFIQCPLYQKVYKDFWDYKIWNIRTTIITTRGFSQQNESHVVFTSKRLTITPTLICENLDKISRNHTMFGPREKRIVIPDWDVYKHFCLNL